ncbi:MAG: hypothetical protein LBJ94_01735, partial [Puniceicoccales bacterium]|nr:hypothetical protein [Puniceicoccales bacterium]
TDEDLSKLEKDIKKEVPDIEDRLARRDALIGSLDLSATQRSLLMNIAGIEDLSVSQASHVVQYCEDLLSNGNRRSFALEVGKAMVILYKNNIESLLPSTITIDNDSCPSPKNNIREYDKDSCNDTVFRDVEMRRAVVGLLTRVMAENGADYGIMKNYFKGQQSNSWSLASLGMKAFFLQQRDLERTDLHVEQGQDPIAAEAHRYFLQEFSPNSPNSNENLLKIFEGYLKDNSFPEETYAKTIAMYKAFTGITLQHLNMPEYIDRESRTISLQRSLPLEYANKPQGIADSTSLDTLVSTLGAGGGDVTLLLLRVPFCDVHALFFMSPELSNDNLPLEKSFLENDLYLKNLFGNNLSLKSIFGNNLSLKSLFGMEHEVICDMSHANREILPGKSATLPSHT